METQKQDYGNMIHKPVMLSQVLDMLRIREDGTYVDATLGGAGHSSEILKRLGKGGTLIGIDQDERAIATATKRLQGVETQGRFLIAKSNFESIKEVCDSFGIEQVDGILMDLGVSSFQLDSEDRGFSYRYDSPIDMRMDMSAEKSGADVVNQYSKEELKRILREYGEEKYASEIATEILKTRAQKPIETTGELVEIIDRAIPARVRRNEKGHPAKRTFQAIRVEVNRELEVFEKACGDAIDLLAPEGRLCVLTFQSLETRICREVFRKRENPCTCPKDFPVCVCGKKSQGKMVGKGMFPTEQELEENPRASCASLRVFEKAQN